MSTVFLDSTLPDDARRRQLYAGNLFAFSPRESTRAFCDFARNLVSEAFAPRDPRTAQDELPVESFVEILGELKPRFIHHPESKRLLSAMLQDVGCSLEQTYFDVPRLRSMAHGDYLRAGIALPFHPHRDTWYSAPQCQLNWWLPVFDIEPENTMAFHPRYWSEGVANSSRIYNYYEWNAKNRANAAQFIKKDTRVQPRAEAEMAPDPQIRIVTGAGGMYVFSGAQMHSTVYNETSVTRWSIDFRTVHEADLEAGLGAPNVDSACTGTTLRDFLRATDLAPLPDELVARYDDDSAEGAHLVYQAPGADEDGDRGAHG